MYSGNIRYTFISLPLLLGAGIIFRIISFTIVFFDPENNVLFSGSKTGKMPKIGKQRKEEGEIRDRFFSILKIMRYFQDQIPAKYLSLIHI